MAVQLYDINNTIKVLPDNSLFCTYVIDYILWLSLVYVTIVSNSTHTTINQAMPTQAMPTHMERTTVLVRSCRIIIIIIRQAMRLTANTKRKP